MPQSDPSRQYTRDLVLASAEPPFVVRAPALPPSAWPAGDKVGEFASLDILGPIPHDRDGMVYVAVFLDTFSGRTWLSTMTSTSGLELAAAVQRY